MTSTVTASPGPMADTSAGLNSTVHPEGCSEESLTLPTALVPAFLISRKKRLSWPGLTSASYPKGSTVRLQVGPCRWAWPVRLCQAGRQDDHNRRQPEVPEQSSHVWLLLLLLYPLLFFLVVAKLAYPLEDGFLVQPSKSPAVLGAPSLSSSRDASRAVPGGCVSRPGVHSCVPPSGHSRCAARRLKIGCHFVPNGPWRGRRKDLNRARLQIAPELDNAVSEESSRVRTPDSLPTPSSALQDP